MERLSSWLCKGINSVKIARVKEARKVLRKAARTVVDVALRSSYDKLAQIWCSKCKVPVVLAGELEKLCESRINARPVKERKLTKTEKF
jgi:LEA14-like dessication related protein